MNQSVLIIFDYLIVEANKQAEKSNNQKNQNSLIILIIWLISDDACKKTNQLINKHDTVE